MECSLNISKLVSLSQGGRVCSLVNLFVCRIMKKEKFIGQIFGKLGGKMSQTWAKEDFLKDWIQKLFLTFPE